MMNEKDEARFTELIFAIANRVPLSKEERTEYENLCEKWEESKWKPRKEKFGF